MNLFSILISCHSQTTHSSPNAIFDYAFTRSPLRIRRFPISNLPDSSCLFSSSSLPTLICFSFAPSAMLNRMILHRLFSRPAMLISLFRFADSFNCLCQLLYSSYSTPYDPLFSLNLTTSAAGPVFLYIMCASFIGTYNIAFTRQNMSWLEHQIASAFY